MAMQWRKIIYTIGGLGVCRSLHMHFLNNILSVVSNHWLNIFFIDYSVQSRFIIFLHAIRKDDVEGVIKN